MNTWSYKFKWLDPEIDQLKEVKNFLKRFNLYYENDIEKTLIMENKNKLLATASVSGKVIKCLAIEPKIQNQGILNKLMTHLNSYFKEKGYKNSFIFVNKNEENKFINLGYKKLATVDPYPVLMEEGIDTIDDYLKKIKDKVKKFANHKKLNYDQVKTAALVVNCNPITQGHLYLMKKASRENDLVIVFVLEEDYSLFPTDIRYNLVKKATTKLDNLLVLKGGDYIISRATFPVYFIGPDKEEKINKVYAELDSRIFGKYIAQSVDINYRYVGEEPYSPTTRAYNQIMRKILPEYGVTIREYKRKKDSNKEIISASTVRQCIREDNWYKIKRLVPQATYEYLKSSESDQIINKIKKHKTRH